MRHSPKPIGTREYFDEVERRKYFVEPHIPAFAEFARWKGKWVLEMGCGIGTDTMNFARAGAFVTAADLSSKSLEVATQRAEVLGLSDRIRFYHVDGENLSLVVPPRQYDLIYSFGVVHHTPIAWCRAGALGFVVAVAGIAVTALGAWKLSQI